MKYKTILLYALIVIVIIGIGIVTIENIPTTLEYCEKNPNGIVSSIHRSNKTMTCSEYVESLAVLT